MLREWGSLRSKLELDGVPDNVSRLRARLEGLGFVSRAREDELEWDGLVVRLEVVTAAGVEGVKLTPVDEGAARSLAGRLGVTYLAGLALPRSYWSEFEARRDRVFSRFERVAAADSKIPGNLAALKAFIDRGRPLEDQAQREAHRAAVAGRQAALESALASLETKPRAVLIYTEGPDAAGKTSTGELLRPVFEGAGYRFVEHHFKAPTAEERNEHWLARFRRALPTEGEALRWDRGPAGAVGYVERSRSELWQLTEEFKSLEQELKDEGVLVLPYYLHRERDRQAATFGRREARATLARRWLESNPDLDAETRGGLEDVVRSFGVQDLRASLEFRRIHARFLEFVDATPEVFPWMVVDSSNRRESQLKSLEEARRALERFGRAPGGSCEDDCSTSSWECSLLWDFERADHGRAPWTRAVGVP